ncbi:hypothetical protein B0O80DRAFT_451532 [Mortierella sp. GBAus27b]|nr:hypothetical protein BGX31_005965 [Mortierella sp. GBA43]KAI8353788.1 hypothetical protein B0O80DRAFT_451532 [Mortierella sp. GBAus27b]
MKALTLISGALLATTAMLSHLSPVSAHMAMSFPPGQAGPWSKNPDHNVHSFIGYQGKKFPCGGYKKGPVTKLTAGQVIKVHFWNFSIDYKKGFPPKPSDKHIEQGRHGGGACEFSLSNDAGKTWWVIGQYTKTCPDVFTEWPVKIPDDVPSCPDSDKCLFSFSWTGALVPQFYHHCANVEIVGKKGGKLPKLAMTKSDSCTSAQGDGLSDKDGQDPKKSKGPIPDEKKKNLAGYFSASAGNKSFNLGLKRHCK